MLAKLLSAGMLRAVWVPDEATSSLRRRVARRAADDPAHWEGDLISGAANSYLATLVERHSRFVILVPVAGKDTRERWVIERTISWLHQQRRLERRYDRRGDIHEAFLTIGCALICHQQLQRSFR